MRVYVSVPRNTFLKKEPIFLGFDILVSNIIC